MLITPHRSQPVRTTHDLRQAMLGMTSGDPLVRPGQIIVVPSLDPEKNRAIGLDVSARAAAPIMPPPALLPGQGFATAASPARLPEVLPYADTGADAYFSGVDAAPPFSAVEDNLARAYATQSTEEPARVNRFPHADEYIDEYYYEGDTLHEGDIVHEEYVDHADSAVLVESVDPVLPGSETVIDESVLYGEVPPSRGRHLRKAPFADADESEPVAGRSGDGWKKGF
jgi:hypothetical protein